MGRPIKLQTVAQNVRPAQKHMLLANPTDPDAEMRGFEVKQRALQQEQFQTSLEMQRIGREKGELGIQQAWLGIAQGAVNLATTTIGNVMSTYQATERKQLLDANTLWKAELNVLQKKHNKGFVTVQEDTPRTGRFIPGEKERERRVTINGLGSSWEQAATQKLEEIANSQQLKGEAKNLFIENGKKAIGVMRLEWDGLEEQLRREKRI